MKNHIHRADCIEEKQGCTGCTDAAREESFKIIREGVVFLCEMVTEKRFKFTPKAKRAVDTALKELGLP